MKVADMHCDTILAIQRGREQGKEISLRKNNLNVDLERMKKGDYLIQNFALFLDLEDPMLAGSPFRYAMKMIPQLSVYSDSSFSVTKSWLL